jgi:quercetin dioxygenase-like cupin family protein
MISFLNKDNPLAEEKNSISITYPRTVNIIFGHYSYPDIIHNFIIDIKNNLDPNMKNYTNVKGGMTDWYYFLEKKQFIDFMTYVINKHQTTHADIFKHFLEKNTIENAWGNEIKKGDSLNYHIHASFHGILYLTKGCDLILPELNLKINPEPGDYYIFPPHILHGFDTSQEEKNRYSLIFNISPHKHFDYKKKLNER